MSILTPQEVADINMKMIGRGIPDQKDDLGYNKPDYNKMFFIGMLNADRTLEETLLSLETMEKYTKRQLADERDDILESIEHYQKLFDEKYETLAQENGYDDEDKEYYKKCAKEDAKTGRFRMRSDYEPRELEFYGIKDNKVQLKFQEYVDDINIWNNYKGVWRCEDANGQPVKGGFAIPLNSMKQFLEDAKDFGKIGYKLPEYAEQIIKAEMEQPKQLAYYGIKGEIVFTKFQDFIQDFAIADYEGRWFKSEAKNLTVLGIPLKNINQFLEDAKEKYNHYPTEKMTNEITKALQEKKENLTVTNTQQTEKPVQKKQYRLSATGEVNSHGFDVFHLDYSTPKMVEELWNLKRRALAYVKQNNDGSLDISTTPSMLPALIQYMKAYPKIDIYDAEHFREVKNKSGNVLKDVSNSDLPFTPYPFQVEDANKIISKKHCLIGHDMGCGKTLIATMVGESLDDEKKLVVCPATLRLNWQKEITRFNNNADVHIVYSKDKEVDLSHKWTIMGFDTVRKYSSLVMNSDINCMFIDEAHNCKAVNNSGKPSSKVAESVIAISNKVKYCYPMTGTPMPTRNKDLFNTFRMLKEYESEKAFFSFGQKFCDARHNGFGMDYNGSSNEKELNELLNEYMVRRVKKDVLPHLQKQRLFIPLENSLMSREAKTNEKHLHCPNEDETFMGLAMTGRNLLSQCKINSAIELAKSHLDAEESIVIVSEFNDTLDKLQEEFGDIACSIRGGMGDKAKQQAVDDFQEGKKTVCLLNLQAGGVGITLTKAHTMIMCDYDWTPANMTQVEDRICRTGQEHLCNIEYLYFPDSVLDNTFIEMITDKSELIDKIVDNAENSVDLENARKSNSTFLDNLKAKIETEGGTTTPKKKKTTRKKKADKEKEEETAEETKEVAEKTNETPAEPSEEIPETPDDKKSEADNNDEQDFSGNEQLTF